MRRRDVVSCCVLVCGVESRCQSIGVVIARCPACKCVAWSQGVGYVQVCAVEVPPVGLLCPDGVLSEVLCPDGVCMSGHSPVVCCVESSFVC